MSERPKRRRARIAPGVMIAALVVAALGGDLRASAAARASTCPVAESSCERQTPAAAKKTKDDDLLDKVGLGSLEDLPWETLPVALGLSALIGAAGGFVYSGLVGTRGPGRRSDSSSS